MTPSTLFCKQWNKYTQNHLNTKKKLAHKDFMQQEIEQRTRDWKVELT
jgi:hypothetical protein